MNTITQVLIVFGWLFLVSIGMSYVKFRLADRPETATILYSNPVTGRFEKLKVHRFIKDREGIAFIDTDGRTCEINSKTGELTRKFDFWGYRTDN